MTLKPGHVERAMLNRLDLLIVNPSSRSAYGDLADDDVVAVEPPLWARLIAGYVRDRGHTVKILDAEAVGASPRAVASWTNAYRPRLVAIVAYGHQPSASTQQMTGAGEVARAIKRLPGQWVPIIMVGGHAAALPERTMQEESVDFVCTGEGPVTIDGLLRVAKDLFPTGLPVPGPFDPLPVMPNLTHVPGLMWRKLSEVMRNPPAPLIDDLSSLHGDAWDLLPMDRYRAHNWQCFGDLGARQPYASIFTSLNCPFRCSFCCISAPFGGGNSYRMRDPKDVVREIIGLHEKHGIRTFKIVDEMFVLNERHYTAICEGLINDAPPWFSTEGINIWAYARVDTVKPHTLALMRRAGFRWLALGIESGSKYVRDGASKRLKNDDIAGVVRAIQAAGINVIGNFIFGLPDDDLRSMRETFDLAVELNCEMANFYSAMAYPGSPLYAEAVAKGWTLPATWAGYGQHARECRPLDTLHVSGAEVLRFRDAAFHAYFTGARYLDMVERKFGAATLAHVRAMTERRLNRDLLNASVTA